MSSLFPLRERVSLGEREPRLVDLSDETADDVFETLSAETTRAIFLELHREPQTASDLADATDTSVQNVQYHVEKLTDAELVDSVDTWYSERGTEMNVYAPCDESLVLVAGDDGEGSLRRLLERLLAAVVLLVPVSAVVGWLTARLTASEEATTGAAADAESPRIATEGAADTAAGTADSLAGLDPAIAAGLAFFLGGLFVLLTAVVWLRYRRDY